jgi:hypothetical protein
MSMACKTLVLASLLVALTAIHSNQQIDNATMLRPCSQNHCECRKFIRDKP